MSTDELDAEEVRPASTRQAHHASWDDRFVAWLIDVILVGDMLLAFGRSRTSSRSSPEASTSGRSS